MSLSFRDLFKRSPRTIRQTTIALFAAVVLLAAVIFLLVVQIQKYRVPQISAEERVKRITSEIGKSVVLPNEEIPTVATVADPERLRNELFFKYAQLGDQVLLYPISQRAVLWRPSIKKVVEVSSLEVALPDASQTTGEGE